MESESSQPLESESRRLHPSSLVFRFIGHIRPFAVPLLLALLFAGGDRTEAWFAFIVGPLMLFEIVRYFTFHYRFTTEGLVVREGILFRNERLVPYARIQNVDTRQGLFHRLLDVIDVRIETATGSEPEAKLTVVSRARLAELEKHLGTPRGARNTEPLLAETRPPRRTLYELTTADSILLGLSPWRGLAIVGVAFGLFAESRPWEDLDFEFFKRDWSGMLDLGSIWLNVAIAALAGMLLVGLSVLVTLTRLYGFRVERERDSLRVTCGLFTRHDTNLDVGRIQTVTIRRPWLLRQLGRASIRITTAAAVEDLGEEVTTRQWLAPVVRDENLAALLDEIDPRLSAAEFDWQPLAPSASRRMTKLAVFRLALLSVPLASLARLYAIPIVPVLLVLTVIHARAAARRAAFASLPDLVVDREGVLTQRETFAFVDRIQGIGLHESPFDRRHGTAQVRVDTAGGTKLVPAVRIPYLERDRAERLLDELITRVATVS